MDLERGEQKTHVLIPASLNIYQWSSSHHHSTTLYSKVGNIIFLCRTWEIILSLTKLDLVSSLLLFSMLLYNFWCFKLWPSSFDEEQFHVYRNFAQARVWTSGSGRSKSQYMLLLCEFVLRSRTTSRTRVRCWRRYQAGLRTRVWVNESDRFPHYVLSTSSSTAPVHYTLIQSTLPKRPLLSYSKRIKTFRIIATVIIIIIFIVIELSVIPPAAL